MHRSRLALFHVGNGGFIHFHFRFHLAHIGNSDQHGALAVLNAHDRSLSHFDAPGGDHAIHGALDGGVVEAHPGFADACFRLIHAALGGLHAGLGRGHGCAGLLELGLGNDAGLAICFGPREIGFGLIESRLIRGQIAFGGFHSRLEPLGAGLEAAGIDLQQELPGLHNVAFLHCKTGDTTHHVGGNIHLFHGLHLAVGADFGLQVFFAHGGNLHRASLLTAREGSDADEGHKDHATPNEKQLFPIHIQGLHERAFGLRGRYSKRLVQLGRRYLLTR